MLSKNKQTPLYSQLAKALRKQIESELTFGEKLPSEKEIGEMYSVSRTTVRLAMDELEKTGYIYRLQGKGSFVSNFAINTPNSFKLIDDRTFFSNEYKTGYIFKKSFYGITTLLPNNLQEVFNEVEFIRVQYIIILENLPVAIVDYYLNLNNFKEINGDRLEKEFLDVICEKENINIKRVSEVYQTTMSYKELNDKLSIDSNIPLLCIEKNFYDINNELIVISLKYIVTNRFKYQNFIEF